MTQVAKVFRNGRSQAVRLPAAFRFEGDEVYIRRDPMSGDVILSTKPRSFDRMFAALADLKVRDDFLGPGERAQDAGERDPFEGWDE